MQTLQTDSFAIFNKQWALVTAGTPEDFNTMTVSWGGLGTLWGKDVATVYIKPLRYTYHYMNEHDYFTVSFYDEKYRKDMGILGSTSGRDGDKIAKTSLTPKFLEHGITFNEAKITLVCKKIYWQDLDVSHMPEEVVQSIYETEAPHRMFIGEVEKIIR